jgi:ribosomal-protein-alanine N-acetyltransferase
VKTQEKLACTIRWLIRRDMPRVLEIERESFDFPWSEEIFVQELRQRNCIGMVVEYRERVIGFVVYNLHRSTFDILNLAVAPEFRRQGVATQILERMRYKLRQQRQHTLSATVRERNLPAQLFFRTKGFVAVRTLYGHWDDSDEDAYVMRFSLPIE